MVNGDDEISRESLRYISNRTSTESESWRKRRILRRIERKLSKEMKIGGLRPMGFDSSVQKMSLKEVKEIEKSTENLLRLSFLTKKMDNTVSNITRLKNKYRWYLEKDEGRHGFQVVEGRDICEIEIGSELQKSGILSEAIDSIRKGRLPHSSTLNEDMRNVAKLGNDLSGFQSFVLTQPDILLDQNRITFRRCSGTIVRFQANDGTFP